MIFHVCSYHTDVKVFTFDTCSLGPSQLRTSRCPAGSQMVPASLEWQRCYTMRLCEIKHIYLDKLWNIIVDSGRLEQSVWLKCAHLLCPISRPNAACSITCLTSDQQYWSSAPPTIDLQQQNQVPSYCSSNVHIWSECSTICDQSPSARAVLGWLWHKSRAEPKVAGAHLLLRCQCRCKITNNWFIARSY